MKLLDRLDRIVRPITIPNLTILLIGGQVLMLIASLGDPQLLDRAKLVWDNVIQGEVWRLFTFLFIPVTPNVILLLIALYLFHLFGTSLERHWGIVRYNAFLWLGYVLTVAAAGVVHSEPVTGRFLIGSVFLAFATYNPNFELRLMFVLPVKIKYLAYLQALGYAATLLFGTMPDRLSVLASIGNYLIFFAPNVIERIHHLRRRMQWDARQYDPGTAARHTCSTCGVNSNSHPNMDFRYCSKCDGHHAYCEDHLRDHEHVVASGGG